jgi:hypothetical protein
MRREPLRRRTANVRVRKGTERKDLITVAEAISMLMLTTTKLAGV